MLIQSFICTLWYTKVNVEMLTLSQLTNEEQDLAGEEVEGYFRLNGDLLNCPSSEPFWFWNDTVYSVYIDCYENFLPFGTRLHMTVGGVEYFLEFSEGVVKLIPFTIEQF